MSAAAVATDSPAAPVRGRRWFTAAELRRPPQATASWPAWSIGLLCVAAAVLSAGAVTALNLYLVLLASVHALGAGRAAPRDLVRLLWPLAALIVIGVVRGFGAEPYAFLRDGWYFSNPMTVVVVGWIFGRAIGDGAEASARGLRAFVVGGTVLALLHVSLFLRFPELLALRAIDVRSLTGTGFFAAVLACWIVLAHWGRWREGLRLNPLLALACLALCLASTVLAFSRTLALVLSVGSAAALGALDRRLIARLLLLALLLAAIVGAARLAVDPDSAAGRSSFIGKLGRAFDELVITDRLTPAQIDDRWRGYESARALRQWAGGGADRWLFGEGLGARVDLGRFQNLSRNPREATRFIPVFHNGYIFVLVKTGAVGIALYGVFLWRLLALRERWRSEPDPAARAFGRVSLGCALGLALSTAVWSGTFHKFDLIALLLMVGFALARSTMAPAHRSVPT